MTIESDEPMDTRKWGREALVAGTTAWAGAAGRNTHSLAGSYWGNKAGNEWGQKAALKLGLQDGFDWGEVEDAGRSGVIGDAFGMVMSVVAPVIGVAAKAAAKGAAKVATKAAGAALKGVGTVLKKAGLEDSISSFVHGTMGNTVFHKPLTMLGRKAGLKVCFTGRMPIRTPMGSVLARDVQPGMLLNSRDEHDPEGSVIAQAVEEVFVREGLVMVLRVNGIEIETTSEHPYYMQDRGWTKCQELQVGDAIRLEEGWTKVEGVVDTGRWETVYNFRIGEFHTYFVGCAEWGFSVWAHNADYTADPVTGKFLDGNLETAYQSRTGFAKKAGRGVPDRATFATEHQGRFLASGEFAEQAINDRYKAYTARKQAEGNPPKSREDWYEHSSFFNDYGPTARGNRFNKKAVTDGDMPYHEVHLKTKGTHVDSYDPGSSIVSRKAIDFDNITPGEFKAHLTELKKKYGPGRLIRSDKYPELDGTRLKGKQIIEVPDSNLTAANRAIFETEAAKQKISIRYRSDSCFGLLVWSDVNK